MNSDEIRKKYLGIVGCFMVLVVPFFIKIINHHNDLETAQSLCPFKMLTGFPCAGCGITKSIICFYEGNLLKSVEHHLFGIAVVFFAIFMIVLLFVEVYHKKKYLDKYFFSKKLGWSFGIILGVYHFGRIIFFVKNNSFADILEQSIWK